MTATTDSITCGEAYFILDRDSRWYGFLGVAIEKAGGGFYVIETLDGTRGVAHLRHLSPEPPIGLREPKDDEVDYLYRRAKLVVEVLNRQFQSVVHSPLLVGAVVIAVARGFCGEAEES